MPITGTIFEAAVDAALSLQCRPQMAMQFLRSLHAHPRSFVPGGELIAADVRWSVCIPANEVEQMHGQFDSAQRCADEFARFYGRDALGCTCGHKPYGNPPTTRCGEMSCQNYRFADAQEGGAS